MTHGMWPWRAVVCAGLLAVLMAACQGGGPRSEAPVVATSTMALVGGRVQPAPDQPPIADGVVLVDRGVIAAVGPRGRITIPTGARLIDCAGATIMAGFWNSHVHFIEPAWSDAATADAARLEAALQAMLTRWGFVHVVDLGSPPQNDFPLRKRIESGEVAGPAILIAGGTIVPAGGSPFYIRPLRLPEARTAEEAAAQVDAAAQLGADAIKLFTGSYAEPDRIVVMPVEVVRGAVEAAHRRGLPVLAHPSNSAGARAAIDGGVDILAHVFPADADGPWDRTLPPRMAAQRMALIPTLSLFQWELTRLGVPARVVQRLVSNGEAQLRAFVDAGGQVLFGTDVGYMSAYETTPEFVDLQQAGLSYAEILAMLTTAPAQRFGLASRTGRLLPGLAADITVVDGDPAQDIRALARVRYTIRNGRLIYARPT